MKKVITIILLILLVGTKTYSQNALADTVSLNELPDTLKTTIYAKLPTLLDKDTLVGSFSYKKNDINRRYTYKVYVDNGKLWGFYTYYRDCSNCITSYQLNFITATALYCCKDPRHTPQKTAKTRNEILAIQKQDGCSKVGVCIF